jgi:hypothetical protein
VLLYCGADIGEQPGNCQTKLRGVLSAAGAQAYLAAERERLIPIIKAAGLEPQ